jgi:multimeric flavodoxin WrbA
MKLTIINGNERHGSTWHCVDAVRQAMGRYGNVEVTEFSLPRDMPHFCRGCFSCFYNGENTCPHNESVQPITAAILDADVVVLASPVYGLDVSGQMKALLDHLCYMWVSHRPDPRMFRKVGLVVTTTAGMGLEHTAKTMRSSLRYWGAAKVMSLKMPVAAMKWGDVSEKKKARVQKEASALAKTICGYVQNAHRLHPPLPWRILFNMMKGMMRKNEWNPRDKAHWTEQGWI